MENGHYSNRKYIFKLFLPGLLQLCSQAVDDFAVHRNVEHNNISLLEKFPLPKTNRKRH